MIVSCMLVLIQWYQTRFLFQYIYHTTSKKLSGLLLTIHFVFLQFPVQSLHFLLHTSKHIIRLQNTSWAMCSTFLHEN